VVFFDAEGQCLKTTYLARVPEPFKATLTAALEAEVRAIVERRPDINLCFSSDGAAPQWTALDAMRSRLPASARGRQMSLVDAFASPSTSSSRPTPLKAMTRQPGRFSRYPEALACHYPIGTGVTEAAAKTVVGSHEASRCSLLAT